MLRQTDSTIDCIKNLLFSSLMGRTMVLLSYVLLKREAHKFNRLNPISGKYEIGFQDNVHFGFRGLKKKKEFSKCSGETRNFTEPINSRNGL